MKELLSEVKAVGIDTNIFIYLLYKRSPFHISAKNLFKTLSLRKIELITSILTLTELLSIRASEVTIAGLDNELRSIPTLQIVDVSYAIAKEAARIRRYLNFGLVDSIQLATALSGRAQAFITNDQRLKKFKGIKIILLKDT